MGWIKRILRTTGLSPETRGERVCIEQERAEEEKEGPTDWMLLSTCASPQPVNLEMIEPLRLPDNSAISEAVAADPPAQRRVNNRRGMRKERKRNKKEREKEQRVGKQKNKPAVRRDVHPVKIPIHSKM